MEKKVSAWRLHAAPHAGHIAGAGLDAYDEEALADQASQHVFPTT
jgi:hypothetical protein